MSEKVVFESNMFFSPHLAASFRRQHTGPHALPPFSYINWHEAVELLYVVSGELFLLYGDHTETAHAGQIIAVNPYILHAVGSLEATDFFFIKVYPPFFDECGIDFTSLGFIPLIDDPEAARIFRELNRIHTETDDPFFLPRFKGLLLCLLARLCKHYQGDASAYAPLLPNLRRLHLAVPALTYIHSHFTEKIRIQQVAQASHISESHLLHIFRQVTGMSVLQYVNHLRFLYAHTLFLTRGMPVGAVCAACGFDSPSYFTREYKKRFGASPSADRLAAVMQQKHKE